MSTGPFEMLMSCVANWATMVRVYAVYNVHTLWRVRCVCVCYVHMYINVYVSVCTVYMYVCICVCMNQGRSYQRHPEQHIFKAALSVASVCVCVCVCVCHCVCVHLCVYASGVCVLKENHTLYITYVRPSQLSGAREATLGSYFGAGEVPTVMAYTDCDGQEPQLANCTGFQYDPYIPSWYCNDGTIAGVKCFGECDIVVLLYCCLFACKCGTVKAF